MSRQPVDDERIAHLTRLGWTARRIAEELGCGESTVTRARVRSGVGRPGPRMFTSDEIDLVERLLADGASMSEAARTIGRTPSSLARRFKGRGWTAKECGEFAMAIRYSGALR